MSVGYAIQSIRHLIVILPSLEASQKVGRTTEAEAQATIGGLAHNVRVKVKFWWGRSFLDHALTDVKAAKQ